MECINLSPTENFGDSFALCSYLSLYQSTYNKFTLRLYDKNCNSRKITCNFPALLKTLAVLDYHKFSDIYVFGETDSSPFNSVMIFESSHCFITGHRFIKLY